MAEYQELIQTLALTLGVAWASGINLYAAVTALGLAGTTGYMDLPVGLQVVEDPLVILAAGFMYCVEFMADKVPGVDSGWDAVHTFVRIPAGALLAASAAGPVDPAISVAAGLLGGSVTAATHAAKAGSRLLINTSPEPFSNWTASVLEDVTVLTGLWVALHHPVLFLLALAAFLLLLCFLLPKIWRLVAALLRRLGTWLGLVRPEPPRTQLAPELERLRARGVLTESEYLTARSRLAS
jgi:hypothetical protein